MGIQSTRFRVAVFAASTIAAAGVLVGIEVPIAAAASTQITITDSIGDPDRCCDNQTFEAIDGNLATGTYTTPSGNAFLPSHLEFGFASTSVNRIRLYKNHEYGPHDLTIQYTTGAGPLTGRTWVNVSGLTNGFGGSELLNATTVNTGGTVVDDAHDSSVSGFASLTFDTVTATGLRITFLTDHENVHYHVFEFEAWYDVNGPPVADAGPDQVVGSGASVGLTGAGSSDPDGDVLTYSWSQTGGPAVTLVGANTATPSFTAPAGPTVLTFQLEVCDDAVCDTDTVDITVSANGAPTADAGPDQAVGGGAAVGLTGLGSSDPDGDGLSYSWTQTAGPAVILGGSTSAAPSFTAPAGPTVLTFELKVCDDDLCDTDTVDITVSANGPPTADAGPDQAVGSGASVGLTGAGSSDPDGDVLTYSWTQSSGPAVTLVGANTATPSFTAPAGPTVLTFQLEVCDDAVCDTDTVDVTVSANGPPTADAGPDQAVGSGASVGLTGAGSSDPDGDVLTYSWTQSSGPAVTLVGANTATPSFTAPAGPTVLTFQLGVCDGFLCDVDTVDITVNAAVGPPPVGPPPPPPPPPVECRGLLVTVNLALGQTPTNGPDVIRGTAGNDIINAGAGDDVICALGGNDIISGNAGDDVIAGAEGDDDLRGNAGDDTLRGQAGNDTLFGQAGNDVVGGGADADVCRGGTGVDIAPQCEATVGVP